MTCSLTVDGARVRHGYLLASPDNQFRHTSAQTTIGKNLGKSNWDTRTLHDYGLQGELELLYSYGSTEFELFEALARWTC